MHASSSSRRSPACLLSLEGRSDAALLAALLAERRLDVPTERRAAELLFGLGLDGLACATPETLRDAGVGGRAALRVAAAFELARRAAVSLARPRARVSASGDVAELLRRKLAHLDHEELWIVALDGKNGVRALRRVAQGGLHGCAVSGRDILRLALREGASAFVLAHNHPSGDPAPSPEDVAMSRVLSEACEIVGVPLIDHVVVGREGHRSLLDLGLLP